MYRRQRPKLSQKEKNCKKAKWLSEEALQIAEEISKKQQRKGKVHPTERTVSKITSSCSVNNAKKYEENNRRGGKD